jgi:hypothetical protein
MAIDNILIYGAQNYTFCYFYVVCVQFCAFVTIQLFFQRTISIWKKIHLKNGIEKKCDPGNWTTQKCFFLLSDDVDENAWDHFTFNLVFDFWKEISQNALYRLMGANLSHIQHTH